MNRFLTLLCSAGLLAACGGEVDLSDEKVLQDVPETVGSSDRLLVENGNYQVELSRENGRILRVSHETLGTALTCPLETADNFRLRLDTGQVVLGRDQRLASVESTGEGLSLRWDGPFKDKKGQTVDLNVTMKVAWAGEGVEFSLEVHNRSQSRIAEARYPILGGLPGWVAAADQEKPKLQRTNGTVVTLDDAFGGGSYTYPGSEIMPWVDIFDTRLNRGLYLASHDPVVRIRSIHFEKLGQDCDDGSAGDLKASCIHSPYTAPGGTFVGSAFHLEFHEGDWRRACGIYREWFKATFGLFDPSKDWLRQATAVQDTMFLLPEGNINYRFEDIPQWGRDAGQFGVKALLISGWHRGGHDNGYPFYEPDPRLGTWDELEAGLAKCHEMGMKVFFFVNIYPIDMDNEWFRRELYQYTQSKDRPTIGYGWGMGTLAARMGLTKRLMVSASPSYPEFRRILVNRFRKLAEVGADGIHIDKMVMAGGLEFGTPLSPDQSSWGGTYSCLQEIAKACREINPDFCIGTEVQWDGVLPFGGVTWWDGPEVWKRTFPEWTAVQGVNMAFGYIPVNNGVRLGRQLLIGPNHWTRSMGSEGWQSLSAYIGEINRIREALKETIYLGEYLGDEQIQLEKPANPHFAYSVFRNTRTGRRACILVNNGSLPSQCKVGAFEGSESGEVEVHQPFAPTRRTTLPVEVTIPNESIVVVVED